MRNNLQSQIFRIPSIIAFLTLISFAPSFCAPTTEKGRMHYDMVGAFSTYQMEIGLDDIYSEFSRSSDLKNGFFTKGKVLNTMILLRDGPNVSLDLLFPGFLIMGICFGARSVEDCGCAQDVVNILNGEIGYRFNKLAVSLVNGLHPFISDGFYHDGGIKLSFGGKKEISGYVYEQDRLGRSGIKYGVSVAFTYYSIPDEWIIK